MVRGGACAEVVKGRVRGSRPTSGSAAQAVAQRLGVRAKESRGWALHADSMTWKVTWKCNDRILRRKVPPELAHEMASALLATALVTSGLQLPSSGHAIACGAQQLATRAPLLVSAFSSRQGSHGHYCRSISPRMSAAAAQPPPPIVPPRFVKVKGQVLTPYGVVLGVAVYLTALIVQIPVFLAYLWSRFFDKKRRRAVDWIIHFWAWVSMRACGYSPEVRGLENLPKGNALYVPNHTSFMDILTMTGFIPRPMKYVSKASILKIPLIGWPMSLAGHIAIKTDSRRSQLQTYKDTVQALKDGNSMITFPEGQRSNDGRLIPFKRGPFKMALASGVPIVPVTIGGLARWYPKGTLLPIDVPKDVTITIHPTVDVPASGLTEDELARQVYATINSALPDYQQAPPGQEPVAA